MTLSLNFQQLMPLVSEDCLVLTPNSRTQKAIYAGQALNSCIGEVITSIDVRSFSQWQNDLWSELSFVMKTPRKISKQSLITWLENKIEKEPDWSLTNDTGMANKVVEAYQNIVAWQLTLNEVTKFNSETFNATTEFDQANDNLSIEVGYFFKWIKAFKQLCVKRNVISEVELLDFIFKNLTTLKTVIPTQIILVGFNHFTPLEKVFFESLKVMGIDVSYYDYQSSPSALTVYEFNCIEDELLFAAQTANKIVKRNRDENITIVVNQLSHHLTEVYEAFSQIFQPEEYKPWIEMGKPKYNVSAGFSVADQSIVKAAHFLLNLRSHEISVEELHFLKNSNYFYWGNEKDQTQYFLHQLCLKPRKSFSINYLLSAVNDFEEDALGFSERQISLSYLSTRLINLQNKNSNKSHIKEHQKNWLKILTDWQWGVLSDNSDLPPEKNSISKLEQKICNEFILLITKTSELKHFGEMVSYQSALKHLNSLSKNTPFQLPSDRSNVQVLGVLEAAGLQFDNLIMVGFSSDNWPLAHKPNPFLPTKLQTAKGMPGSSANKEYQYSKRLTELLLRSSKKIAISSSSENGGTHSNRSVNSCLSSLIPIVAQQCGLNIIREKPGLLEHEQSIELEQASYDWVKDSSCDFNTDNLTGGTALLSGYAKCPFNSFLKHQFKLSYFEMLETGVDARQRGTWLHDTMQSIWEIIQDKESLLSYDSLSLEKLVEEQLKIKLEKIKNYLLLTTGESVIQLEMQKLKKLIINWLSIESERENFKVKHLEKEESMNLQDMEFGFRLDRVDENNLGQLEIIDYKTGKTDLTSWFSVRPTEAQMPAYMLALRNSEISALDYARIKKGEVSQIGLSFDANATNELLVKFERTLNVIGEVELKESKIKLRALETEVNRQYEDLLEQWELSLNRIALGISTGYMPVSPKNKVTTCQYCEYKTICRIDERQPDAGIELLEQNKPAILEVKS